LLGDQRPGLFTGLGPFYGEQWAAGVGVATALASGDFETFSTAGFEWNGKRWAALQKGKPGIEVVGAWAYSEHPSTIVTTFAYNLKDGQGERLWWPGLPNPQDLFDHLARGGLFEATNSFFEFAIWTNVCVPKYGWPPLSLWQVRDVAAKAAAWTLPRKLETAAKVLKTPTQKDAPGRAIMLKVSKPHTPTEKEPFHQYTRENAPDDFAALDAYCVNDVRAEDCVSARCPDLSEHETRVFLVDQSINVRGVMVDRELVAAALDVVAQAENRYNAELAHLTGGRVQTHNQLDALKGWLWQTQGVWAPEITKDTLPELLALNLPPAARRGLEIRAALNSQSVKKTRAMWRMMGHDARLRGLYTYAGAARTWRWAGSGVQPQNLPNAGPPVQRCGHCGTVRWARLWFCPSCFRCEARPCDWGIEAAEACIPAIFSRSLDTVEALWGDALTAIAGCLRSFFIAAPGNELICSDFTAIEAVVIAQLAGEEWRLDVFRTHGKIYEASAARIFGVPFAEFERYKRDEGMHHPLRKKGKTAELASGYQGWVEAWRRFGADGTDDELAPQVAKWRRENPAIVALWHGLEAASIAAVENPGQCYRYREIAYQMGGDVLYCRLPSGRCIPYHKPRIREGLRYDKPHKFLSYMGVDSKTKQWVRIEIHGGKHAENITQATSRDLFADALLRLETAGYPIVIHTHDEPAAEVAEGSGSIEQFEALMRAVEPWAQPWADTIKAAGGWRGKRYRKD
jgi:hypothetical protein